MLTKLFPDVLRTWKSGEDTFYEMPLFRMNSLRHLIFEESDQERCLAISKDVVEHVLETTFNHLYTEDRRSDIYDGFVQLNYFKKYESRLRQTKELLAQLKETESGSGIEAYEKLLDAKSIKVGDIELQNPTTILNQLKADQSFMKYLQPPFLCMIHGDLHFDNILVDDRLPKRLNVILIDPRGFSHPGYCSGVGDIAYDIGKLLHSANGYYDFIHSGYLSPDIWSFRHKDKDRVEVSPLKQEEWATVPEKRGGSGAIIISHKQIVQAWTWSVFDYLADYIKMWVSNHGYVQEDPNWWLRAKFNEAMHFCTMGKFHLQEDVGRAFAIQVRGIELMNDFYHQYKTQTL
ncbi:MAG: aminoglycoside phosphotransferase family protein [Acidobacteria bacterium]|nr:aminoglycoside phosphotransferase family protein [Acidobacteriota bacterium]